MHREQEWRGRSRWFVAAQIVHYHDVASADCFEQLLVGPGAEAPAIDRTIEDVGSENSVAA